MSSEAKNQISIVADGCDIEKATTSGGSIKRVEIDIKSNADNSVVVYYGVCHTQLDLKNQVACIMAVVDDKKYVLSSPDNADTIVDIIVNGEDADSDRDSLITLNGVGLRVCSLNIVIDASKHIVVHDVDIEITFMGDDIDVGEGVLIGGSKYSFKRMLDL